MTSNDNEENIQSKIQGLEDHLNSSRLTNEKKLGKISKQLEILELTVRKINASKRKDKRSKDLNKRLSKVEDGLKFLPKEMSQIDEYIEEVIAKIINIESNRCNYVPRSATSSILEGMKKQMLEQKSEYSSIIKDQELD